MTAQHMTRLSNKRKDFPIKKDFPNKRENMNLITKSVKVAVLAAALFVALPGAQAASTGVDAKVDLGSIQANQSYDGFIVTYRSGSVENTNHQVALNNINQTLTRYNLNLNVRPGVAPALPVSVRYRRHLATGDTLIATSRALHADQAAALMRQIAANPAVTHVEVEKIWHAVGDSMDTPDTSSASARPFYGAPNDPLYSRQWDFDDSRGGADVENAWSETNGSGIVVAVLDTGITRHPDLNTSLADAGYDFISDEKLSNRSTLGPIPGGWDPGDWGMTNPKKNILGQITPGKFIPSNWHGTHVAGTIAAKTNNGIGTAGIAYGARILPVRVLGRGGHGNSADTDDAIVWAAGGHVEGIPDNRYPAKVINLSLGGKGRCDPDSAEARAIARAIELGATVVAAAGNFDKDARNFAPANCPGVISVAAVGFDGRRASYSNYGQGVTIAAPGGGIYVKTLFGRQVMDRDHGFVWSTFNSGQRGPGSPAYAGMAGTSMAAPHVTGVVALLLSAEKAAGRKLSTPAQVKQILVESARAFPFTPDKPIGAGIVDARVAVDTAMGK